MITTIVFDLGGVLIDWNPEYLYRKIFSDEKEMKNFLDTICTPDWNEEQDAGRTLDEATEILVKQHPKFEEQIRAYYSRWPEMLNGEISDAVDVLRELKESGKFKLYALSNWSAETFPIAERMFSFLEWFDEIMVSGKEKMRKPFTEFYDLLLKRYNLNKEQIIFIDDNIRNVEAAEKLGIESLLFTNGYQLKKELRDRKVL
jgi:2-haloacid dehalogenase